MGALDTAYLTYAKLTSTPLACPASGSCSEVLNSSYASVGPVPLSFLGLVAYLTVAYLSFNASSEVYRELLWWLCCTMALTSLGLTGLLIFVLQAPCLYCAASAFITAMLLALVETKRARDLQPALAPAELPAVPEAPPEAPAEAPAVEAAPEAPAVAVEAAPEAVAGEAAEAEAAEADLEAGEPRRGVLALSGVVALGALRAGTLPTREFASAWAYFTLVEQYKPNHPPVRSSSSKAEMALAKHLRSIGAACYTAWWCPHCQEQRESFGREATEARPKQSHGLGPIGVVWKG